MVSSLLSAPFHIAGRYLIPFCLLDTFIDTITVAATGMPKPQADHAVLMAKFAFACVQKMPKYVKKMETQFGRLRMLFALLCAFRSDIIEADAHLSPWQVPTLAN